MNGKVRFPSYPKPITQNLCLLNPTRIRQKFDKLACPQPQYPWGSPPLLRLPGLACQQSPKVKAHLHYRHCCPPI
ncbi:hypothetical protein K443DRAFT_676199 [Laccaria amethystina LaAM-08-1]|uniref:Uncharacterized protein n=1 Tax=Laccaria amethystina LaAM-08-1 TaxID=1095629 RepID=A0A0C9Y207_9AGAR|nr:hypothetical protein K443DRAFT_676199 [Laccaria amethystina LaAM-08-1]